MSESALNKQTMNDQLRHQQNTSSSDQSPELKKANLRMAFILGGLAIVSLVMAGISISRMMAVGA